jgi:hypothetical protein
MGKFYVLILAVTLWSGISIAQITTTVGGQPRRNSNQNASATQDADDQSSSDTNINSRAFGNSAQIIGAGNAAKCITKDGLEVVIVIPTTVVDKCGLNSSPDIEKEEKAILKANGKNKEYISKKRLDFRTRIDQETGCYFGAEPVVMHINNNSLSSYTQGYNEGMRIPTNDTSDDFSAFGSINADEVSGKNCKNIIKNKLSQMDHLDANPPGCTPPLGCHSAGTADGLAAYNAITQTLAQAPAAPAAPVLPPPVAAAPTLPQPTAEDLGLNPLDEDACGVFDGALPSAAEKTRDYCKNVLGKCLRSKAYAKTCNVTNPDCPVSAAAGLSSCQSSYHNFCNNVDNGVCGITTQFVGRGGGPKTSAAPTSVSPEIAAAITTAQGAMKDFKAALAALPTGDRTADVMTCGLYRFDTNRPCSATNQDQKTYTSFNGLESWMKDTNSALPGASAASLVGQFNTELNRGDAMQTFFTNNKLDLNNTALTNAFAEVQGATAGLATKGFFRLVANSSGSSSASLRGGFSDLDRFDAFTKIRNHGLSGLGCLYVPQPEPKSSQLHADYLNAIIADASRVDKLARAIATCNMKYGPDSTGTTTAPTTHRTTH